MEQIDEKLPDALRWSFNGERARVVKGGGWVKASAYDELRDFANGRMCAAKSALRERDQYKAERDEARRKEVAASELLHHARHILEDAAVYIDIKDRANVWLREREDWVHGESA